MHIYCSRLLPQRARDGPLLSGTCAHSEHQAPGGRWALPTLTMQLLFRIISNWKHLCYWGWLSPIALHAEVNSSTENAPQERITCGLLPCSSDTLRGREVLEDNQPALSLYGKRKQASQIWIYLKDKRIYETITGASNNFILLVLATLHCLSLKKHSYLLDSHDIYLLQCKLSTCYFSILFLLLAI